MSEVRLIVRRVDVDNWQEEEKLMVPHSTIDTCRLCQEAVWVSPEGNKFIYEEDPDAELICIECHIQLEVERREKGDETEVKNLPVPGASVPITSRDMRNLVADFEDRIKQARKERDGG